MAVDQDQETDVGRLTVEESHRRTNEVLTKITVVTARLAAQVEGMERIPEILQDGISDG